jgi:hypothetical protein
MTVSEINEDGCVIPECFRAYVNAEIKVPNTLIAVGPYVGRAALASLQAGDDLKPAVERFAKTYTFSRSQMDSVIKVATLQHRRLGVGTLPDGADLRGQEGIRIFPQQRFEVVYMEGVMNILEAILRFHGVRGEMGSARGSQVAELLQHPDKLAATLAAFAAAEDAINSPSATEKSEAFKAIFNFIKSGEKPRAMFPAEKDAIQAEEMPFIILAVRQASTDCGWNISPDQIEDFVRVLTSPELHEEAA